MMQCSCVSGRGRKAGGVALFGGLLACLVLASGNAIAESGMPGAAAAKETIPALMVSDIHFEPFWDPGKVAELAAAPVSGWKRILAAPVSADRETQFRAIEDACHTRGDDTSYPLLASGMRAIEKDAAHVKFVTVSGDLISHAFACKFGAAFPKAAPGDYRAFVEKTIDFVVEELRGALPGVPVYVALGNNDSDCGDYKLDAHGEFLAATGAEVTKDFSAGERKGALESFSVGGYYSVMLPAPVEHARLLVLNDLFMSGRYETCAGKEDTTEADVQLAWLGQQLAEARNKHEKVWVMGHIPPGVDVHASALKPGDVCGKKGPKMFLGSEKIAEELAGNSDVIQLAVFAHTHMDEMRILRPESGSEAGTGTGVAVKMVSSISPINGNAPSFTIARVDPSTAALVDYTVIAASNATGVDTAWKEEYDWGKTYHEGGFSAASLSKVIAGFKADPVGKTEASRDYMHHFFSGNDSLLLGLVWPQYVCGLWNDSAEAYKACACTAGH
jgi:sphingomyelin phosphodiesterase acid-like 3